MDQIVQEPKPKMFSYWSQKFRWLELELELEIWVLVPQLCQLGIVEEEDE